MKHLFFAFFMLCFVSALIAQDGNFSLDKTYTIDKSGIIDLRCSDAKVFITGSARNDVHVKIERKVSAKGWSASSGNFSVEIDEQSGNLKIHERQTGSNVSVGGYYKEDYRIDIEAPQGVSLSIRGDDGDQFIKNINGAITLSVDDADVELAQCKGKDFNFRIDDGDIRMDGGKGNLEITADDADIEIYHAQFTSIKANVDDGDLIIETSIDDDGIYKIHAQDGSIALNITEGGGQFDIRHDDTHVSTHGPFKSLVQRDEFTQLSLSGGQARVFVTADDARLKLTAHD
jgi:hypothetical protein